MRRVYESVKYCESCGKAMGRKRYAGRLEDLTAYRQRRFCSLSCANTRQTLTKHGYSWRARKHLRMNCEACGSEKDLEAHHIDQTIKNNAPQNIQTLCKKCHDFWHSTGRRIGKYPVGRMASLV